MRVTSTALQIACCIKRARIESKKLGPIEGDVALSHTEKEAIRVSNHIMVHSIKSNFC